jgi:hypothetical protein
VAAAHPAGQSPGRSIAVMGPHGAGKNGARGRPLAGELSSRDERLVLVDAAGSSNESLRAWVDGE